MTTFPDQPAAASPEAQQARRDEYMALCRQASLPRFSPDGSWVGPGGTPSFRERMWHCLALLGGEQHHVDLANRILETSDDSAGDFTCYFTTLLLRLYSDRLTPEAQALLRRRTRDHIDHVFDHIYRYTENCAALNTFALYEYARESGEDRYARRATERLEHFHHQRQRNGVSHEFVSVNYLPVFQTGIASLARWAPEAWQCEMAGEVEEKIWRELAVNWHTNLRFSAGPSGRSYTTCSMGLAPALNGIVWVLLGDEASPSPMDLGLFRQEDPGLAGAGDLALMQSGVAVWCATVPYQVSTETADLFYRKTYPFAMYASVALPGNRENEPAPPGVDVQALGGWWRVPGKEGLLPGTIFHPGGRAVLSTYMTEDYGVGASTRLLFSQCDFCHGIWRRREAVEGFGDRRTLYTRYIVNNQLEEKLGDGRLDLVSEQGRGGCLQSGPLAVAWYAAGEVIREGISKLRTCILLSEYFNDLDEVCLGEEPVRGREASSEAEEWVFLRDGLTYLGLRPLALTNHGRQKAVEVSRVGHFRVVSFYNYEGEPRDFLGAEIRQTCGGLVFCVGSEREWGGFARFRQGCREVQLSDCRYESQRRIACRWEDREVDILWDLQSEELIRATRDGEFIGEPYLEFGST